MRISDWSSDVCSSDLFLAFADGLLDARRAHIDSFLEITARDFLERQEAVTLFAITDEAGFQARLDAGDDAFVDVSLALFAPGRFDIEVNEFLTVDNGNA